MNIRPFFLTLFFCANFFHAQAQQNAPVRHISDTDRLSVQQSEVENFQYQTKRFLAAIEDGDQKNMDVMHGVLVGLMEKECAQAETTKSKNEKELSQLQKSVSSYEFKAEKASEGAFLRTVKQLDEFAEIMKEELAILAAKANN